MAQRTISKTIADGKGHDDTRWKVQDFKTHAATDDVDVELSGYADQTQADANNACTSKSVTLNSAGVAWKTSDVEDALIAADSGTGFEGGTVA